LGAFAAVPVQGAVEGEGFVRIQPAAVLDDGPLAAAVEAQGVIAGTYRRQVGPRFGRDLHVADHLALARGRK